MNTQELLSRLIRIKRCGYGQWIYTFLYRDKEVSVYDTDATKYDAITTGEKTAGTTQKQALAALWYKSTQA